MFKTVYTTLLLQVSKINYSLLNNNDNSLILITYICFVFFIMEYKSSYAIINCQTNRHVHCIKISI